jgi:tripeptidyl-peptidase-1
MEACKFLVFILFLFANNEGVVCKLGVEDKNPSSFIDGKGTRGHVFKEKIAGIGRLDLARQSRISPEINHEVVFVIKQRNVEKLTAILHDVSDPKSMNYGKHKTREEVADLTANPISRDAVVSYLTSTGATVVSETLNGEYVTVNGPIRLWEELFHTEFFMFHQTQVGGHMNKLVRAEHYSIPAELDQHVESVFNTIQMPVVFSGGNNVPPVAMYDNDNRSNKKKTQQEFSFINGAITPDKLRAYYNISSSTGSSLSTQAVVLPFTGETNDFSPNGLELFLEAFQSFPLDLFSRPERIPSTKGNETQCRNFPRTCGEGNLDMQYIMSTSPVSPTTFFYYSGADTAGILVEIASATNVPLVLSLSFGSHEETNSKSELDAFNTQAIKLGVMGVTIVVSTGDDGANSRGPRGGNIDKCGYIAKFPASSPYVTAVGATQGPELTASGVFDGSEITCSSSTGAAITSGGGFSNYYMRATTASFQSTAVDNYLKNVAGTNRAPVAGFNTDGRGYPDLGISLSYP